MKTISQTNNKIIQHNEKKQNHFINHFANFSRSLVVLGCFGFAACATTPAPTTHTNAPKAKNPYKIEVTNPYTPPNMSGQRLIRVALLAPFNSNNPAVKEEAQTMQSAVQLALSENGDSKTVLFTQDSGATPEEAANATKTAISMGADVILGPLFASGVAASVPYTRNNDTLMFAFSTDITEAGNGVYVLSYLPESEATRVINYAAQNGISRLAFLIPNGRYGDRVLQAANAAAANNNITILATERYDQSANNQTATNLAARKIATAVAGGPRGQTAILIPERGATLRSILQTLSTNGASTSRVRYLGTSIWNDATTLADSRILGSWFASTDNEARERFENRFRQATSRRPTKLAGLGYDAMTIVAKAARNGDKASLRNIDRQNRFDGIEGSLEFRNGIANRTLSIMEIGPQGLKMIDNPK